MARIVPALSAALGTRAAGRRRAVRRRRSGRLGPRQHRRRSPRSSASSRASCSTRSSRPAAASTKAAMALANRWVTTRQLGLLLGFMGPRVLGQYDLALLSAEADAGPAAVRRGEHPGRRPGRSACRSARSGPGSRSTRRRTPSSSRRIRGCGRTSPSGSSASSRSSAATPAGLGREALRGLGRALRGEGGGEHWMERLMGAEQRAPVPRDAGGDEPARGLQRLRHGRGRARPRARTSSGSAPGSTSVATERTPFERAMLRLTGMDLKMEQYKKGEQFVRAIADAPRAGRAGAPVGRPGDAAARRRDRGARALDRPRPRRRRPA